MQWFVNLKTRVKLLVGFGVMCALMAGVGAFAANELTIVNASTEEISKNSLPSVRTASAMNTDLSVHRIKMMRLVMAESRADLEEMDRQAEAAVATLDSNRHVYEALMSEPAERALYTQFGKLLEANTTQVNAVIALARAAKQEDAKKLLLGEGKRTYEAVLAKMNEIVAFNNQAAEKESALAASTFATARVWLLGLVGAGLAIAVLMALTIAGIISRPLARAVEVLKAVAAGDFVQTLDVKSKDELGQLATSLNQAVTNMRNALQDVRGTADSVASASLQLSAGSEEISSGAQEQASSLEETASSLEEIASTIKQSADNAQQANQLASGARDVAEKGGRVVSEAVQAMNEINESSKQIADIINTIDEIAFQTNLLALNAAVEAARAGEQGRGFAVVAAEVRNLAKRSATSAKEIKVLIQDSVRKVENGSSLVNQSGQTLQEIVTAVKRVTDIVGEIAAATREQSTGIDQVNRAVTQMDAVTQSNAGQTEELAGTAESLSAQAAQLQQLVAQFRLEESSARGVVQTSSPSAATSTRTRSTLKVGGARKVSRPTRNAARTAQPALASRYSSLDDDGADVGDESIFEEL